MFSILKTMWRLSCLFACILWFSGCATYEVQDLDKYRVDNVQYGVTPWNFLGKWWDFYERGQSFAEGKFFTEAESDLRNALAKREQDFHLSRTYGMHFIPYFGNRELGIVLYQQGRIKEAIPYLKRSLDQDPTEKAAFYLNECMQMLSANILDNEAPLIQTDAFPELTNSLHLSVSGTTQDNLYVDHLTINGKKVNPILKQNRVNFSESIPLHPGRNQVEIQAFDTKGNHSSLVHSVIVDLDAPVLFISEVKKDRVIVTVSDEHEVQFLIRKAKNVELMKQMGNSDYYFRPLNPAKPMSVDFEDAAGNRNGLRIEPNELQLGVLLPNHPRFSTKPQREVLLASVEVKDGVLPISKRSVTSETNQEFQNLPRIEIEHLEKVDTVFQEYIILSGRIVGAFQNFRVNGKLKVRKGKDIRFSFKHHLRLNEVNPICIQVSAPKGKKVKRVMKTLAIKRLPSPIENRSLRAILKMTEPSSRQKELTYSSTARKEIFHELFQSRRFNVLAPSKIFGQIKEERNLYKEGWLDPSGLPELNRQKQADYHLECVIQKRRQDIEIIGRLIDPKTKEMITHCNAYRLLDALDDFKSVYERFVYNLTQSVPLIECDRDKNSKLITGGIRWNPFKPQKTILQLDCGENRGIREGMLFLAYHRTKPLRDSATREIIVNGEVKIDARLSVLDVKGYFSSLIVHDRKKVPNFTSILSK